MESGKIERIHHSFSTTATVNIDFESVESMVRLTLKSKFKLNNHLKIFVTVL